MTKEEAISKWIVPAIENTWNEKRCKEILEALEQEPCGDAISRQAVMELPRHTTVIGEIVYLDDIKALPPVQPKAKIGRWIKMPLIETGQNYSHKCSLCGRRILTTDAGLSGFPYCHCGAKMTNNAEFKYIGEVSENQMKAINKTFGLKQDSHVKDQAKDVAKEATCSRCPYKLGRVTFFDDPCPDCIKENYGFGERMIAEKENN